MFYCQDCQAGPRLAGEIWRRPVSWASRSFSYLPISHFQLRKYREIAKTACMISEHRSHWLGLPVELYDPETTPNYAGKIYRLAISWESETSFSELFERFTESPECTA